MRKFYVFPSVTVFVVGVFTFGRAAIQKRDREPYPAVSFEATYPRTSTSANREVGKSVRTRQVQANGEWREVLESSEKKGTIASLPEGPFFYTLGEPSRVPSHGRLPDKEWLDHFRAPAFLRSHPAYVDMSEVAGLEVYVHRETDIRSV
jgi:hypothetical protein